MELRLSLIRSPNYPDTINVDEDLKDYFSEPRQVKINDQITIRPLLQPGLVNRNRNPIHRIIFVKRFQS